MTVRVLIVTAILLSLIGTIGCHGSSSSSSPPPTTAATKDGKPAPKAPARTPKS
jgi:hypothetical protein